MSKTMLILGAACAAAAAIAFTSPGWAGSGNLGGGTSIHVR
jgi:hypothetical protein